MKKLRVEEVIVVEGKYDAAKLADLVDGLILTTNGFSVFKNAETKRLLVELGKKRGDVYKRQRRNLRNPYLFI